MRVVIVIQARTASTRLPGKVLLPVHGAPLLARMVERVRLATSADHVMVATTRDRDDDPIVALCERMGLDFLRGHPTDCLARHLAAARAALADAVVKIPSDCPMIDPEVIDRVIDDFRARADAVDYVGNLHPGSWPDGNDVEVMHVAALERAAREASSAFDREHTTPYLWSNPDRFRLRNVTWDAGLDLSRSHRWVVDWQPDLELVSACFDALYPVHGPAFHVADVLALLEQRPEIGELNAAYRYYDYRLTRPDDPEPAGPRSGAP